MDRGRRAEPYSNATTRTREIAKNFAGHLDRLSRAQSCVDSGSPKSTEVPHFRMNPRDPVATRKDFGHRHKTVFEKPKVRILKPIDPAAVRQCSAVEDGVVYSCKKLSLPGKISANKGGMYGSTTDVLKKSRQVLTGNDIKRKQQTLRIWEENQAMLQRILKVKPTLNSKQWERDEKRNRKWLKLQEKRRRALHQELMMAQTSPKSMLTSQWPRISSRAQLVPIQHKLRARNPISMRQTDASGNRSSQSVKTCHTNGYKIMESSVTSSKCFSSGRSSRYQQLSELNFKSNAKLVARNDEKRMPCKPPHTFDSSIDNEPVAQRHLRTDDFANDAVVKGEHEFELGNDLADTANLCDLANSEAEQVALEVAIDNYSQNYVTNSEGESSEGSWKSSSKSSDQDLKKEGNVTIDADPNILNCVHEDSRYGTSNLIESSFTSENAVLDERYDLVGAEYPEREIIDTSAQNVIAAEHDEAGLSSLIDIGDISEPQHEKDDEHAAPDTESSDDGCNASHGITEQPVLVADHIIEGELPASDVYEDAIIPGHAHSVIEDQLQVDMKNISESDVLYSFEMKHAGSNELESLLDSQSAEDTNIENEELEKSHKMCPESLLIVTEAGDLGEDLEEETPNANDQEVMNADDCSEGARKLSYVISQKARQKSSPRIMDVSQLKREGFATHPWSWEHDSGEANASNEDLSCDPIVSAPSVHLTVTSEGEDLVHARNEAIALDTMKHATEAYTISNAESSHASSEEEYADDHESDELDIGVTDQSHPESTEDPTTNLVDMDDDEYEQDVTDFED